MAKIKVEIEAQDHGYGSDDGDTIEIKMAESEIYRDSIELNVDGRRIHVDKTELKKAVSLLCD